MVLEYVLPGMVSTIWSVADHCLVYSVPLLINGTTIHKFSCKLKKFKAFMEMKLDYIFVDEVT